jgi:hypothetical protein
VPGQAALLDRLAGRRLWCSFENNASPFTQAATTPYAVCVL